MLCSALCRSLVKHRNTILPSRQIRQIRRMYSSPIYLHASHKGPFCMPRKWHPTLLIYQRNNISFASFKNELYRYIHRIGLFATHPVRGRNHSACVCHSAAIPASSFADVVLFCDLLRAEQCRAIFVMGKAGGGFSLTRRRMRTWIPVTPWFHFRASGSCEACRE